MSDPARRAAIVRNLVAMNPLFALAAGAVGSVLDHSISVAEDALEKAARIAAREASLIRLDELADAARERAAIRARFAPSGAARLAAAEAKRDRRRQRDARAAAKKGTP